MTRLLVALSGFDTWQGRIYLSSGGGGGLERQSRAADVSPHSSAHGKNTWSYEYLRSSMPLHDIPSQAARTTVIYRSYTLLLRSQSKVEN
jgi:hypothetical protein